MNIKTEIKEYGFPVTHNCVRSETRITELEAQLAECRKIRNDYSMGVDPIEYNEMCYKTAGMHDQLVEVEAQLAAAQAEIKELTIKYLALESERRRNSVRLIG